MAVAVYTCLVPTTDVNQESGAVVSVYVSLLVDKMLLAKAQEWAVGSLGCLVCCK